MNVKEKIMEIKNHISIKKDGNNKKSIENLIIFIIILIITVASINYIWNDKNENRNNTTEIKTVLAKEDLNEGIDKAENEYNDISSKLEKILKSIKGVGDVKVLITYSQTSTVVPMYNEDYSEKNTQESDSRWRNKKYK